MSVPVRIKGLAQGGGAYELGVNSDGALPIAQQYPVAAQMPAELLTRRKLFYGFLRVGGEATGSRDMHLATGATEFWKGGGIDRVVWITSLRIILEGTYFELTTSGDFRRFGAVAIAPGLTNGVELYVLQGGVRVDIFLDPVKTMGAFFNYSTSHMNFVNAISSQGDFLALDIDLPEVVAFPARSLDRIVCKINDNMVNDNFLKMHVLVKGYQELVL